MHFATPSVCSDRKRMSVIVRCPGGQIKLYVKGAVSRRVYFGVVVGVVVVVVGGGGGVAVVVAFPS